MALLLGDVKIAQPDDGAERIEHQHRHGDTRNAHRVADGARQHTERHEIAQRVDLDADMIELMSKEIAQYSKRINQQEDINEDFLLDINQLQDNTMTVRENIVDKQRLISNMMKSDKYPSELEPRFNVLLQDISSLINHSNFSFERLEYLQDTVVGLINLDQNRIMKIFTLISLLLMPPTLVASFYGMNVALPLSDKSWSWVLICGFMIFSLAIILYLFKRRKML